MEGLAQLLLGVTCCSMAMVVNAHLSQLVEQLEVRAAAECVSKKLQVSVWAVAALL